MKKIVSLLLAVMLCLACFTACAEGLDLTGVEATITSLAVVLPTIETTEGNRALTSHVVETTDTGISITVDNLCVFFDFVSAGDGYLCLTQDMFASINAYSQVTDPNGMHDYMVEFMGCLLCQDFFTKDIYMVRILGADSISQIVGNLSDLSESDVASIAKAYDCEKAVATIHNGTPWLYHMEGCYITVIDSQLIVMSCSPTASAEDVAIFLNALTFTPVK